MRQGKSHKESLNMILTYRLKEYYKKLLNGDRMEFQENNLWIYEGTDMEITIDEVMKEIKFSKNGKSTRIGATNSELL